MKKYSPSWPDKSRQRGLTLLEVLISMAIMSVLVTATGYAISSSLKIGQENRRNQDAAEVAQAILERYRTHWRSFDSYATKGVPAGLSTLIAKLPGSYTVTINPNTTLNPDGSVASDTTVIPPVSPKTIPTYSNVPSLRQLTVEIKEGSRVRAWLETKIGNPTP